MFHMYKGVGWCDGLMRYSMIRAQLCFMALLVAIALATDRGLSSTFGRPSLPAQAVLARLTAHP